MSGGRDASRDARPRCAVCGYDIGAASDGTCPECGAAIDEAHLAVARRRTRLAQRFWREITRHALAWIAVVVAYSIGAGLVADALVAVRVTLVTLGAGVGASAGAGLGVAAAARPWERRVAVIAWARAMWWMHAPWLVLCPGAAILVASAWVDRLLGLGGMLPGWIGLVALPVWALGVFLFMVRAFVVMLAVLDEHALPERATPLRRTIPVLMGVLLLLVFAGASVIGFVGGMAAGQAAGTIAGAPR